MSQIAVVQKYVVNGKEFNTEIEALTYANREKYKARVDAFIESRKWARGRDTAARNIVEAFVVFEELGIAPAEYLDDTDEASGD